MPYASDRILDFGLNELVTNAENIHACTSEPADFAAVAAASLGSTTVTVSAIADRTGGGREVTITPAAGQTYGSSGNFSHYAVVDTTNSRLLLANATSATKAVNSGDAIDINAMVYGQPDSVSA